MSEKESTNPDDYRQGMREVLRTYTWVWRELLGDLGRRKAKLLAACLCASNLIAMTIPWLLGEMINALLARNRTQAIAYLASVAGVLLTRRVVQRLESRSREIMIGSNMGTIDERSNQLFLSKSLGQHLREHDLLSAAGMEKGRARTQDTINLLLTEGCEIIFLLVSTFVALWLFNQLAGLASTAIFAVYIGWSLYLNQRVAIVCAPLDEEFRALNRYRTEHWENVDRVKANGKEAEETRHMTAWWNVILRRDQSFWLWFCDQCTIRSTISTLLLLSVMGINVWQVWEGRQPVGRLLPLFLWMQTVLENVWRLGNLEHRLNWNLPSVQSLKRALTLAPDVTDAPDAKAVDTSHGVHIEFRGVTHTYRPPPRKERKDKRMARPVLTDINFTVEPGEVVALLGRSGAGKSTIMRLLQRGMDPEGGQILINGQDLRCIQLTPWLQDVGYIPQRPSVFEGTVRDNLLYGVREDRRAQITDEDVWTIMRRLRIDLGDRLEDGLETLVGKNGIQLSGGEQQRLMIGAAVAKHPRFYLIDEATSSLDSSTERDVQDGLAEALQGAVGALIIAHRLSTVREICTKFIVLRPADELTNGTPQIEAVASSFEELYRLSPTFRQLAHDQGIKIDA